MQQRQPDFFTAYFTKLYTYKELNYEQFILPVLEYAAPIWDPYHLNDINKIEMMQYRAAIDLS